MRTVRSEMRGSGAQLAFLASQRQQLHRRVTGALLALDHFLDSVALQSTSSWRRVSSVRRYGLRPCRPLGRLECLRSYLQSCQHTWHPSVSRASCFSFGQPLVPSMRTCRSSTSLKPPRLSGAHEICCSGRRRIKTTGQDPERSGAEYPISRAKQCCAHERVKILAECQTRVPENIFVGVKRTHQPIDTTIKSFALQP